jgi:hypothetical protein
VSDDDRRLREDIRALADQFEAGAQPEERVTARLSQRSQASWLPSPLMLVAVATVVIVAGIGLRTLLPAGFGDGQQIPQFDLPVGLFRSVEPNHDGECVAMQVYDTTGSDGQVALWIWTATSAHGCGARRSNLLMGPADVLSTVLPAGGGLAERPGKTVLGDSVRAGEEPFLIMDPLGSTAGGSTIPGYWSWDDAAGEPTLLMERIEQLTVPYRPD